MDDIDRYYNILGLKPGASQEEVKQAYRDLVKVWHPDRFSHDPRLREKAQEKLKEINRSYEQLASFFQEPGYQAHRSQPRRESAWDRSNKSQEPSKPPPRDRTTRKFAFQVQAILTELESRLRSLLVGVGIKVPPLTDEGRIIAVMVIVAAFYLIAAAIYLIVTV